VLGLLEGLLLVVVAVLLLVVLGWDQLEEQVVRRWGIGDGSSSSRGVVQGQSCCLALLAEFLSRGMLSPS
jgi:high-affinity Fe2+/Pb2+ permease